jgi:hypothetical protein
VVSGIWLQCLCYVLNMVGGGEGWGVVQGVGVGIFSWGWLREGFGTQMHADVRRCTRMGFRGAVSACCRSILSWPAATLS